MIRAILKKIKNNIGITDVKKETKIKYFINKLNVDLLNFKKIDFRYIDTKQFVDMPDTEPKVKLFIPKVGVTNRPHYIKIKDPFKNVLIDILTFIKIFMPLEAKKRGLHMSRIERVLYSAQRKQYENLSQYLKEIIYPLMEKQNINECMICLKGIYEKETDKNFSGKKGHEILHLYEKAIFKNDNLKMFKGLGVYFMNACPCPQRWAIRKFYYKLKEKGYSEEEIYEIIKEAPLESHTNRGIAKLFIENDTISFKNLYEILDSSVTIVRELLSGNDEHLFIREAHEKELFCEDVVRNIAYQTIKYLNGKINDDKRVFIKVEVDESIHFHNLYAEIKTTFRQLKKSIQKDNENI